MEEKRVSKLWKSKGIAIDKETLEAGKPTKENLADFILSLSLEDISFRFIMNTFSDFSDGKGGVSNLARPYDLLEVPTNRWSYYTDKDRTVAKSNVKPFITTLGIFVFNKILNGFNFCRLFNGYLQVTLNNKQFSNINKTLSYALLEDKITTDELKKYLDYTQWCMTFETALSPNHTEKMITCTKAINAKKNELIKKYKEELDKGSPVAAEKIENELKKFAADYLGDDPSMDTIYSNAVGDWDNNFKNMYIMKGAVQDPDPNAKQKYRVVTGNFMDGIPANEYPIAAGAGVQGAYARGKKTANGGYFEKLFIAAFQTLKLDPPGSDCGTKHHIRVRLTSDNIGDYMYCYVIKNNGELELINSETKDKYVNTTVNLRFASMCESKTGICNKCAGELFYILGEEYMGLNIAQIPDVLKLRFMKGFHNAIVQTNTMDVYKAFYPWEDEE